LNIFAHQQSNVITPIAREIFNVNVPHDRSFLLKNKNKNSDVFASSILYMCATAGILLTSDTSAMRLEIKMLACSTASSTHKKEFGNKATARGVIPAAR
jgi:hypothetical protein